MKHFVTHILWLLSRSYRHRLIVRRVSWPSSEETRRSGERLITRVDNLSINKSIKSSSLVCRKNHGMILRLDLFLESRLSAYGSLTGRGSARGSFGESRFSPVSGFSVFFAAASKAAAATNG
jgi:hypothetical protein